MKFNVRDQIRKQLQAFAVAIIVLGLLHHADHVFRGNHSGWPFTDHVTPFTFSLLVYPLVVIGLVQLARDKIVPLYWISVSLIIALLITFVHFVPAPKYERASTDIFLVYADPGGPVDRYSLAPSPQHLEWLRRVYGPHANAVWGGLALSVLALLTCASWALVWTAFSSRILERRI